MVPGPTIHLNKVGLKSSLKRHSMAHFKAVILSCGNFISINGGEDIKPENIICAESRHYYVLMVIRYLGRNLLDGNMVIRVKEKKEKRK